MEFSPGGSGEESTSELIQLLAEFRSCGCRAEAPFSCWLSPAVNPERRHHPKPAVICQILSAFHISFSPEISWRTFSAPLIGSGPPRMSPFCQLCDVSTAVMSYSPAFERSHKLRSLGSVLEFRLPQGWRDGPLVQRGEAEAQGKSK